MSYTDERDKIAKLFGVDPSPQKSGYSDEAEELLDTEDNFPALKSGRPASSETKMRPGRSPDVPPSPSPSPSREPIATGPEPIIEDETIAIRDFDQGSDPRSSPPRRVAPTKPPLAEGAVGQKASAPSGESDTIRPPEKEPKESKDPVRDLPRRKMASFEEGATGIAGNATGGGQPATGEKKGFLLETRGLVKIYDGKSVVKGVDINVRPGEIVGLLGPNGAGKTTSFYMIVGLVPPNGGEVIFGGRDVTTLPMYQRARLGMGYLPQEESIFRKLTVEENIMAVMETLDLSRRERLARCQELLEKFGITHIRKNLALTCSGGEKRRLTIARSLVTRPSLLMLDEPFSGVDPIAVNEIQNIVEDLRKSGLAVLITDHNARQTLELVDRAYLIYEGKVLREGTRDFLINDPVSRELYLGDRFTM